jgi:tetratricopeptide (TPR) repeat protein
MTLASLQDRLERARLEYAARRYDSTAAILQELGFGLAEVVKMREPLPDRVFLAASAACLMARAAYRQKQPSLSTALFANSVALFRLCEKAIPQQKLPTRLCTDYGIALYRTGDTERAIRLLEEACTSGATPPEAFGYLGMAYQSKDHWDSAEECLRKGLQLAVDDPVLTRHLAVVLEKRGKLDEAAAAYEDAALAYQRINQLDAAAELIASTLRLAPADPHALVLAVQIEHARQKPENAAAIVEKVLHDDPMHPWARGLQALMLRDDRGQLQEALEELSEIDANAPELSWVLVERARTLMMVGSRVDEALALLERAATLDPNQAGAPLLRGEIEMGQGNYEAAIRSLVRAAELDPQNAFIPSELGRAYLGAGQMQEAHANFDRALAADRTLVAALTGKANAYIVEGKIDDALLMIRRARQFEPDNSDLVLFLAEILCKQNRPEGALAEVESQLQRRPEDVPLLTEKGNLLVELKRYGDAQKAFDAAAALDAGNAEVQSKLAETARLANDYEKAGEAYVRVIELQPESASAMARYASYLSDIAAFEEAVRLSRAALQKEENRYWIWTIHGWNLQHLDRQYLEEAKEAYERALALDAPEITKLWVRKHLANTLCGLGYRKRAEELFEGIVEAKPHAQDPDVTALLGWCQFRLRRYDEALRLLQFSLLRKDPTPVQFDLALTLLAAGGSDEGYSAAIESAEHIPILRQRGLFYIALFDLVEAIREEQVSSTHLGITKKLSEKLAESGVDVSKLRWLPEEAVQRN